MSSIAHGDPCVNGRAVAPRSVSAQSAESPLLAAANARLLARRAQLSSRSSVETRDVVSAEKFPQHLNWGSAVLPTKKPARSYTPRGNAVLNALLPLANVQLQNTERPLSHSDGDSRNETMVVQPSLLVAMLRAEVVAIGRIYLLCRHLDTNGRGWLSIEEIRARLTGSASPLRVCGWRRLRQILQAGKGYFWERDDQDRLWLYGLTRVAARLEVSHFSDSVTMPLAVLCGSIGDVRGAFYASFHGGRDSSPIARATLRDITGVPERTQRTYDDAQQIERTTNVTLIATPDERETFFEHGRAAFPFNDKNGTHGQAGRSYIAVRLPNSYQTTRHVRHPKKQTRLNKRLRQDLVKFGTRGNGYSSGQRIFFTDGQQAARQIGRSSLFLRSQAQGNAVFWMSWGRK